MRREVACAAHIVYMNYRSHQKFLACRPQKMIVCNYMSADDGMSMPELAPVGQLCASNSDQVQSLQGFKQYLSGFRGAARPASAPKMAVIETSTYKLLLKEAAQKAAIDCWASIK